MEQLVALRKALSRIDVNRAIIETNDINDLALLVILLVNLHFLIGH